MTQQTTVTDTFHIGHGIVEGDTLRRALRKLREAEVCLDRGSYRGLGGMFELSDGTAVEVGHVTAEGGGCLLGQYEAVRKDYAGRGQVVRTYKI